VRVKLRVSFVVLVVSALVILAAPVVAQAAESIGIEKFAAVNCSEGHEQCAHEVVSINLGAPFGEQHYSVTKEPKTAAEVRAEGELQAGGHVPFGVTDFTVAYTGSLPTEKPIGTVTHIRTDVATGLATNPASVHMCSNAEFGGELKGTGLFTAPTCNEAETKIGVNQVTVYVEAIGADLALEGNVYNLEQPKGRSSNFGAAIKLPIAITKGELEAGFAKEPIGDPAEETKLEDEQWYSHTLVEGNVEWGEEAKGTGKADYHDYFEINVSPALPLVSSRLVLYGRKTGEGDFIENATSCPGDNTTKLTLTDLEHQTAHASFTTPEHLGLEGCKGENGFVEPQFFPGFTVKTENAENDQPDELATEFSLPSHPKPTEIESGQVKTATVTLPEGLTLNPAAAAGLEDCTATEAHIHSEVFGVSCPSSSEIGTDTLNVPGLPEGSLTGKVYLGGPETGPITGPPYIVYVVANSTRYGISVRLKGEVTPNLETGQLITVFNENPEQPFTDLKLEFNRNALTSLANPLICGTPEGTTSFASYTGATSQNATFGVPITGCGTPLPFSLGQTTEGDTSSAGAHTSYDFTLTRKDGEQFLNKVKTTLPEGLVGVIPDVTQCGEPQAAKNECGAASRVGTATVKAGAGNSPYTFSGPVYLTGPYSGAPYGLLVSMEAAAGPFNLGKVVTRATVNINPTTARVTTEATLPTIVGGIPIRLRSLNVNITRQGYLDNPTHCSGLETESTLTSTLGTVQSGLLSPLTVEGCSSLPFKPTFTASTVGKFGGNEIKNKQDGASLTTTITQAPGQANIKSVLVQLPKLLPSRLTTLQKACLAKTFEENPFNCSKESRVGSASAVTPVLPNVMTGPAILVSHAGEEFPSLELVLEADNIRVIVEGKTHITKKITTTDFESTPDVPVSSITVSLPTGAFSALALEQLNTNVCTANLVMPTTVTGQNGSVFKQNTVIAPTECSVQILSHRVAGNTAYVKVETYAAGRITASGKGLKTTRKTLTAASKSITLKIPLSSKRHRRPFKLNVRVGFTPKAKGASSSSKTVSVKFG
jgi:hypothetical protein